jgi:hypothetical protein
MLPGVLRAHSLPGTRRTVDRDAGKRRGLSEPKKKGADPEGYRSPDRLQSATGGNMQTAPYQFEMRPVPSAAKSLTANHRDKS